MRLPEGTWKKQMRAPSVSLSYGARREVLAQIVPHHQEATGAQKMLLLDRVGEVTGYARKYAIQLLNHVPESAMRIVRPRQPISGLAVQKEPMLVLSIYGIVGVIKSSQAGPMEKNVPRRTQRDDSYALSLYRFARLSPFEERLSSFGK
jgi:hypothetical protein